MACGGWARPSQRGRELTLAAKLGGYSHCNIDLRFAGTHRGLPTAVPKMTYMNDTRKEAMRRIREKMASQPKTEPASPGAVATPVDGDKGVFVTFGGFVQKSGADAHV